MTGLSAHPAGTLPPLAELDDLMAEAVALRARLARIGMPAQAGRPGWPIRRIVRPDPAQG